MSYIIPNENLNKQECPLAVIKCVDWRFRQSDQEFIEKGLGFAHFDLYAWPGSGKEIINGNGFKKSFVEKIVQVSKNLHQIKKILLLWHHDCEVYTTLKNFKSSHEEEQLQKDLHIVREILIKELPNDLEIIMAYSKLAPQGLEYMLVE